MNILILNWRDPKHPLAGGAEQSLHEHAKYWKRKGAEITWFASSFKKAKKEDAVEGIKIIRSGSHFTVHLMFLKSYIFSLRSNNYDVIIDCFHFLPFFTPLYIKKTKKIALINETAGKLWFSNLPFLFAWIGYKIEPLFFKPYKKTPFITASNSASKDLEKIGIPKRNITIVPHGVILSKNIPEAKKEKSPTIIYCSRITKDKGIEDALKAFRILKKEITDLEFWIVGKEEKEGYLREVFKVLKVGKEESKNIKYFGFVDEKKKFDLLSKAWILIHPSKKEGWGLNVIEANGVGTPAVGYNVEGLRDSIRDKKTGLLSEVSPNALAKSILTLIKNEKIRKEFSDNAVKWSKEFSWEKSGQKSWELLRYRK